MTVDAPADVTPTPRKPGAPRKWLVVEGEELTTAAKRALRDRARNLKAYVENKDAILERNRRNYHARMKKYHEGMAALAAWSQTQTQAQTQNALVC